MDNISILKNLTELQYINTPRALSLFELINNYCSQINHAYFTVSCIGMVGLVLSYYVIPATMKSFKKFYPNFPLFDQFIEIAKSMSETFIISTIVLLFVILGYSYFGELILYSLIFGFFIIGALIINFKLKK